MKSKKRKIITVEAWRKTVVRKNAPAIFIWCDECGIETQRFTPEEFARLGKTTARIVYQKIESGDCHFIETQDGEPLICGGAENQDRLLLTGR